MNRLTGSAVALAFLTGCAGTPAATQLASADGAKVECRNEVVTGSNRKERICATVDTWAEADGIRRQQAEDQVDRANRKYTDTFRASEADAGLGGN